MKNLKTILMVVFLLVFKAVCSQNELPKLGLVSELAEMKCQSEATLLYLLDKAGNDQKKKMEIISRYNEIRTKTDQILLQLTADMKMRNSVKKFKRLNRYYQRNSFSTPSGTGKSYYQYSVAFQKVDSVYQDFLSLTTDNKKGIAPEIVLSVLEFAWTIVKDIQDMKAAKVDGISEILDTLRLAPAGDLIKAEAEGKKQVQ